MRKTIVLFLLSPIILFTVTYVHGQSKKQMQSDCESNVFYNEAIRAYLDDNDNSEEEKFRQAIDTLNGKCPDALLKLSIILSEKLRFSEAIPYLEQYIKRTPRREHENYLSDLKELRRIAALKSKVDSQTEPSLEDLLELIPKIDGYGRLSDAIPYAEKAVRLYPQSANALLKLSQLLGSTDNERALALIRNAIALEPDSPDLYYTEGYTLSLARRYKEAEESYLKAIRVSSGKHRFSWYELGFIYLGQKRKKDALNTYRKYLQLNRSNDEYRYEVEGIVRRLEREVL